MTISFLTDEHVPRVFISTLRSNDFTVKRARDVLGRGTPDAELLEYAAENDLVLITHDKKDFGGELGDSIEHAGLVIYTDPVFLRQSPANAVHTIERIIEQYPSHELAGSRVWIDQWRSR